MRRPMRRCMPLLMTASAGRASPLRPPLGVHERLDEFARIARPRGEAPCIRGREFQLVRDARACEQMVHSVGTGFPPPARSAAEERVESDFRADPDARKMRGDLPAEKCRAGARVVDEKYELHWPAGRSAPEPRTILTDMTIMASSTQVSVTASAMGAPVSKSTPRTDRPPRMASRAATEAIDTIE